MHRTRLQVMAPTAIVSIVVIGAVAGCATAGRPAYPTASSSATTQPDVMRVEVIAGVDGGVIRAGQVGWVWLGFENPTGHPLRFIGAVPLGQAAGARPCSYFRHTYFGLVVAPFTYAFVDKQGRTAAAGVLSPPDSELKLLPGGWRDLCRQVKAPDRPGDYDFEVTLDFRPIIAALCTLSNAAAPPPEQGWVLRARAEAVVIADLAKAPADGTKGP